ncbi:trypsin-like serine peptidase [Streptomyces sp. NRRL S-350]|uniref:trypsin-like serine peptidase n=1 Tax=Streptomyces sp. NRRL S-350 TaxID=1463902 RepID=UPI0004C17C56|nr:trypsin-like peptidase domain-containing protein [Streptomyces sp. NRRL S-350]
MTAGGLLPVLGATPAHANDEVCRPGSGVAVAFGYTLQPCVYQDSDGVIHAKVTSTGGTTDVRLFVQIGTRYNGGSVAWQDSTLTDSATNAGDHVGFRTTPGTDNVAYSSLVNRFVAAPNTTYYARAYLTDSGTRYGDVEAGPIGAGGTPSDGGSTWTTRGEPTVGKLYYHLGPVQWNCTGTVIAVDLVATAGHCIYNSTGHAFGGPPGLWLNAPSPDRFVPNDNSSGGGVGSWYAQDTGWVTKGWHDYHAADYDFGVYRIKPRSTDGAYIGNVVGTHRWKVSSGVSAASTPTYTVGYPGDYSDPRACNAPATRFNGDNSQLRLSCTFADGASGGPLSDSTGTAYANVGGYEQGGSSSYPSYGVVWNSAFDNLVRYLETGGNTSAGASPDAPSQVDTTAPRVAPNANPALASLPDGTFQTAWHGGDTDNPTGSLWIANGSGTSLNGFSEPNLLGVAAGTSPSIVANPDGSWTAAWHGADSDNPGGSLWLATGVGTTLTSLSEPWKLGVAAGTSPSLAALPGGGWALAWHGADTGNPAGSLWVATGSGTTMDRRLGAGLARG